MVAHESRGKADLLSRVVILCLFGVLAYVALDNGLGSDSVAGVWRGGRVAHEQLDSTTQETSKDCHAQICKPWTRRPELPESNSSWHRCLHYRLGAARTRCYFRNVCVDREGTLLYYTAGKEPPDWRIPLLYMQSRSEEPYRLNFSIVNEPLPIDTPFYPNTAVYFHSFWPENFGHALDDNFFSAYRVLNMFDMAWDEEILYLTKDDRADWCNATVKDQRRHCEHLQEFSTFLGGKRTYTLKNPPKEWTSGQGKGRNRKFCARHLVAGFSGLSMNHDQERQHDHFVDLIMCKAGVNPRNPLPLEPRIAFFNKTSGRRRTLNTAEIADAVRETFKVPVDVLDISSYSFVEQIHLMQNYTVGISPDGGISMTTMFLPYGAAGIYIGTLERWMWTSRRRFRDYFYQLEDDDLVYNRTEYQELLAKFAGDPRHWQVFPLKRDSANRIKIPKMLKLVDRALKNLDYYRR